MSATITINATEEIQVQEETSLLKALAQKNIYLSTACGGRGICGLCKVEILSPPLPPTPAEEKKLTPEEIKQGMHLACQVRTTTNISCKIDPSRMGARRFKSIVAEKKFLTYDIVGLTLDLVDPAEIQFTPGHYVQIEGLQVNQEPVIRAYSMASSPLQKKRIEIMVRKVPGGLCSTWVHDVLAEGDTLWFSGAFGEFHLSSNSSPMIFIGGGSGMAPFWSILRYMKSQKIERKVTYFFGARSQQDLFLVAELAEFASVNNWFSFIPALSEEPVDSNWQGERGLITEVVGRHFPHAPDHEAYLCGAPGMIDASIKVLVNAGVQAEHIFYDKFM